jgi:hypothetical protein
MVQTLTVDPAKDAVLENVRDKITSTFGNFGEATVNGIRERVLLIKLQPTQWPPSCYAAFQAATEQVKDICKRLTWLWDLDIDSKAPVTGGQTT